MFSFSSSSFLLWDPDLDIDTLFGNDGHLLFEERISTLEVKEMNLLWADDLLKAAGKGNRASSFFGLGGLKKQDSQGSSLDTTVRRAGEIEKAKLKKRGSLRELPFEAPADYPDGDPAATATSPTAAATPAAAAAAAAAAGNRGGRESGASSIDVNQNHELRPLNPAPASPPRPKMLPLPATMGLGGHLFDLSQVYICQFTDSIGILRFAVSAREPVGVQTTLDLLNGLMRLQEDKTERPSIMRAEDGRRLFAFHPLVFIESLLTQHFGDKGVTWEADKETDRLFVYSMGVVSDCEGVDLVKKVVYKISQMEDDARAVVSEEYLDDFAASNSVYKRFATADGGIWSTFHVDGGSTLIFADAGEARDIPLYAAERMLRQKKIIHGSSRPLLGFSLSDLLIFRRMFLRRINQELDQLIVTSSSSRKTLTLIRGIHLRGLRFRAKFTAAKVSTTRAGKEQYLQWDEVMGMDSLQGRLQETLSQLNEYYSGIEDRANQKHIDMLTIVLGCLGSTSLVVDLTSYYEATTRASGIPFYVPGAALGFFTLLALFFIFWTRAL